MIETVVETLHKKISQIQLKSAKSQNCTLAFFKKRKSLLTKEVELNFGDDDI